MIGVEQPRRVWYILFRTIFCGAYTMATSNVTINSSWTKIVNSTATDFLVTWSAPDPVEFAATDADTAPVVQGHALTKDQALTRAALGPGHVWAKTRGSVVLVVSND